MAAETPEPQPTINQTLTKLQTHFRAGDKLNTPQFLKDVYQIRELGQHENEKVDHLLKTLGRARKDIVGGAVLGVLQEGHRTADVHALRRNIGALRMLGLDTLPKVNNLIGVLTRAHNLEEPPSPADEVTSPTDDAAASEPVADAAEPIGPIHGPKYQDYQGYLGALPRVKGRKNGAVNGHRNQTPEEFVAGLPRVEFQKDRQKPSETDRKPRFIDLIRSIKTSRERIAQQTGIWPDSLQKMMEIRFEATLRRLPPDQREGLLSLREESVEQTVEHMYQDLAEAIFEEKVDPSSIDALGVLTGEDFKIIWNLLDKKINLTWASGWADAAPHRYTSYPLYPYFPHTRREDLVAAGVPVVGERPNAPNARERREFGGVRPVRFVEFDEPVMPPVEQLVALVPESVKRRIEQQREIIVGGATKDTSIITTLEEVLPQIIENYKWPDGFIQNQDMSRIIYSVAPPALRVLADQYFPMEPGDPEYSDTRGRFLTLLNLEAGIDNVWCQELNTEEDRAFSNFSWAVDAKTSSVDEVIAEFINYQKARYALTRFWNENRPKIKALEDSLIAKLNPEQREALETLRSKAEVVPDQGVGEDVVGESLDQPPPTANDPAAEAARSPAESLQMITDLTRDGDYDKATAEARALLLNTALHPQIEQALKAVLEQNPTNPNALRALGDLYMRQGKFQEAIEQYNAVIKTRDNPF